MCNRNAAVSGTLFVATVLLVTASGHAQETLYYADIFYPTFSHGYLRKVNTDGTGLQTLVNTGDGLRGVAVDRAAGKIYWTDVNADAIWRCNLNGTGVEDLVTAGLEFPMAIDLNPLNRKLYWGDQGLNLIGCANLDGSNPAVLLDTSFSSGLAVDAVHGKIYWSTSITGTQGEIRRANLDGSGIETVVTGAGKPATIAVDVAGGKVYWTDYVLDVVRRANLDGTGVEDLFVVGANLNPGGIALDLPGGKVYWGQDVSLPPYVGKIMRMNLDGSDPEDVAVNLGMVTDLVLPAPVLGDLDNDNNVDLTDFLLFADCMTGPNIPPAPGCKPADLEHDNDVDLADFRVLQAAFTGS
jgi:DNA-binding beta-propeller fold protein YncE